MFADYLINIIDHYCMEVDLFYQHQNNFESKTHFTKEFLSEI